VAKEESPFAASPCPPTREQAMADFKVAVAKLGAA